MKTKMKGCQKNLFKTLLFSTIFQNEVVMVKSIELLRYFKKDQVENKLRNRPAIY